MCRISLLLILTLVISLSTRASAQEMPAYTPAALSAPGGSLDAPLLSYAGRPQSPAYTAADMTPYTASFYFALASDTTGTPILNYTNTGGQPINLAVWYTTNLPHKIIDVLVGYDRSTSAADTATRLDNKIVLNGDADSAVTNINPSFNDMGNAEGGGAGSPGAVRPYGDDIGLHLPTLGSANVTAMQPTHLFDISLQTTSNYTGAYDVTIYSNSSGTADTTYVFDSINTVRPPTYTLHIADAPEPSAWLTLASGTLGLAFCCGRRRLRLKAIRERRIEPCAEALECALSPILE